MTWRNCLIGAVAGILVLTLGRAAQPTQPQAQQEHPEIRMEVSAPEFRKPDTAPPDFVYWEVKVQYKNEGKEEVVLYPCVTLKVLDADSKPVPNDVFLGIGVIQKDWGRELEKQFLVIPPGKSAELRVNLSDNRSPSETIGWKFKKPGTYKIVLTYQYSREEFAKKYLNRDYFPGKGTLERAKHPQRLWNRAVEMERTVETKLVIGK